MIAGHCHTAGLRRRGLLLMEILAAVALLGVVLAIGVPMLASVAVIRTEAGCRQQAQLEIANLMEQIAQRHRQGETVADIAPTIALSSTATESLPRAKLAAETSAAAGLPDAVEVALKLTWVADSGGTSAPVELHAFFVEHGGGESAP
jgi:Tfp pilus assembly protein PilE